VIINSVLRWKIERKQEKLNKGQRSREMAAAGAGAPRLVSFDFFSVFSFYNKSLSIHNIFVSR
jgi:hypothetical protein